VATASSKAPKFATMEMIYPVMDAVTTAH